MSVNMSGSTDADYSDYQYQTIVAEPILSPEDTGNGDRVAEQFRWEPLEDRGGLSVNEVAELVYLETYAAIEFDTEQADQNVASQGEIRGVAGINLPAEFSAFPARGTVDGDNTVIELPQDQPGTSATDNFPSISDPAYLQMFAAYGHIPFDDQAGGPGGAGSVESFHGTKHYRQLTNRGPVFDQNDDFTILTNMTVDDVLEDTTGVVRCHAIWDVAETDDAGERFAVPM